MSRMELGLTTNGVRLDGAPLDLISKEMESGTTRTRTAASSMTTLREDSIH